MHSLFFKNFSFLVCQNREKKGTVNRLSKREYSTATVCKGGKGRDKYAGSNMFQWVMTDIFILFPFLNCNRNTNVKGIQKF